jgi:hypothetical protein
MENEKNKCFDWDKMPDDAPQPFMPDDYEFDILKQIDEDGRIRLPRHTGNTETQIDTLPGAADLRQEEGIKLSQKSDPKQVWVTYDPLYERVVCVHDAPDCLCETCKPIWDGREEEGSLYQLEERRFIIMEYDEGDLEEI